MKASKKAFFSLFFIAAFAEISTTVSAYCVSLDSQSKDGGESERNNYASPKGKEHSMVLSHLPQFVLRIRDHYSLSNCVPLNHAAHDVRQRRHH